MKPLTDIILEIIEAKQPKNIKDLIALVQKQASNATVAEIKLEIRNLQQRHMINLEAPAPPASKGVQNLFQSRKNVWFWATIILVALTFASVLLFPGETTPVSYVRYSFAVIFVVFLPGYCLTEALFPKKDALDIIERITLSVGLSFAVTALIGLFLSFTPIGLTLVTALPTLSLIVIVLAIVSLARKYKKGE